MTNVYNGHKVYKKMIYYIINKKNTE